MRHSRTKAKEYYLFSNFPFFSPPPFISMSFLKGRIQLSDNQTADIRTRNTWLGYLALPCCTYLNLKRIQLPDDSDDEQLVDEQDLEYESQPYMPSHIPTFQTQNSQQILSKNPFARAEEPPEEDGKPIQAELEDSGQTNVVILIKR